MDDVTFSVYAMSIPLHRRIGCVLSYRTTAGAKSWRRGAMHRYFVGIRTTARSVSSVHQAVVSCCRRSTVELRHSVTMRWSSPGTSSLRSTSSGHASCKPTSTRFTTLCHNDRLHGHWSRQWRSQRAGGCIPKHRHAAVFGRWKIPTVTSLGILSTISGKLLQPEAIFRLKIHKAFAIRTGSLQRSTDPLAGFNGTGRFVTGKDREGHKGKGNHLPYCRSWICHRK